MGNNASASTGQRRSRSQRRGASVGSRSPGSRRVRTPPLARAASARSAASTQSVASTTSLTAPDSDGTASPDISEATDLSDLTIGSPDLTEDALPTPVAGAAVTAAAAIGAPAGPEPVETAAAAAAPVATPLATQAASGPQRARSGTERRGRSQGGLRRPGSMQSKSGAKEYVKLREIGHSHFMVFPPMERARILDNSLMLRSDLDEAPDSLTSRYRVPRLRAVAASIAWTVPAKRLMPREVLDNLSTAQTCACWTSTDGVAVSFVGPYRRQGGNKVWQVQPLPDELLATSGRNVKIWSSSTGALVRTLRGHGGNVRPLLYLDASDTLISGAGDGTVRLWPVTVDNEDVYRDQTTDQQVCLPADMGGINSMTTVSSSMIAAATGKGKVPLIDLESQQIVHTYDTDSPLWGVVRICQYPWRGATPGGGPVLALATYGSSAVQVWDTRVGQRVAQVLMPGQPAVSDLAPTRSLGILSVSTFSYSKPCSVLAFDTARTSSLDSSVPLHELSGHTDGVSALHSIPGTSFLASGSYDLSVKLWDLVSGRKLYSLRGHVGWILHLTSLAPVAEFPGHAPVHPLRRMGSSAVSIQDKRFYHPSLHRTMRLVSLDYTRRIKVWCFSATANSQGARPEFGGRDPGRTTSASAPRATEPVVTSSSTRA